MYDARAFKIQELSKNDTNLFVVNDVDDDDDDDDDDVVVGDDNDDDEDSFSLW